jgi:hypothetical protein
VIDDPSFTASIVIRRPEAATRMVPGLLAQPVPQCGIGIGRCGRGTFVALDSAVLPGHPAGEPFADPQHPLDVTNSCPLAFRA